MTTKPQLICWDSCVIINCVAQHAIRYPDIAPIETLAEKGELKIIVSEISVAEVVKLDSLVPQGIAMADQVSLIDDWFERDYVVPRVVDREVSTLAAQIQREHKAKTCDAVILATAILHRAECLYTYDGWNDDTRQRKGDGVLDLDGAILDIAGKPFSIKAPPERPGQMVLV